MNYRRYVVAVAIGFLILTGSAHAGVVNASGKITTLRVHPSSVIHSLVKEQTLPAISQNNKCRLL